MASGQPWTRAENKLLLSLIPNPLPEKLKTNEQWAAIAWTMNQFTVGSRSHSGESVHEHYFWLTGAGFEGLRADATKTMDTAKLASARAKEVEGAVDLAKDASRRQPGWRMPNIKKYVAQQQAQNPNVIILSVPSGHPVAGTGNVASHAREQVGLMKRHLQPLAEKERKAIAVAKEALGLWKDVSARRIAAGEAALDDDASLRTAADGISDGERPESIWMRAAAAAGLDASGAGGASAGPLRVRGGTSAGPSTRDDASSARPSGPLDDAPYDEVSE